MNDIQKELIYNKARKDFPNSEIKLSNSFLEINIISYNINFDVPSWTHIKEIRKDKYAEYYNIILNVYFYSEDTTRDFDAILKYNFIEFKVFSQYNKIGRKQLDVLLSFKDFKATKEYKETNFNLKNKSK